MDENNSKQIEIRTLLDDSENIVIWPITRADAVQRQNNSSVETSLQIAEEALTRCVYVDEEEDVDIEDLNPTTPTSAVTSVNGKIGNVVLNATDVGARPNNWMPTANDVGARSSTWYPTPAQIDAVPISRTINGKTLTDNITLTATDVGARPSTWMPTAADVGARPNTWFPSHIEYSTITPTSNNTEGGLKVCVLNSEPTTKYEGWLYLIKE